MIRMVLMLMMIAFPWSASAQWERYPNLIDVETFKGDKPLEKPMVPWPAFIKEMDTLGFNARDHAFQYVFGNPEQSQRYCFLGHEMAISRYRQLELEIVPICASDSGMNARYYWVDAGVSLRAFRTKYITTVESEAPKGLGKVIIRIVDETFEQNVHYFRFWADAAKNGGMVGMYVLENAKTRRLGMKVVVTVSNWYIGTRTHQNSEELVKGRIHLFRTRMLVHNTVGQVPEVPLTLD